MKIVRKFEIIISRCSPKYFFLIIELVRSSFKSYSEFGEDLTIEFIISKLNIRNFSYIDIGCHRPISGSNTYKFYKMGKRGTAVDANKFLEKYWKKIRKNDIFLNVACSTNNMPLNLYIFDELASSNTVSQHFAEKIQKRSEAKISNILEVQTLNLNEIIRIHRNQFTEEFFISMDIEGMDENVIKEWYPIEDARPFCIVIEDTSTSTQLIDSSITKKLIELDYIFIARGPLTSFFVDRNKIENDIWNILAI